DSVSILGTANPSLSLGPGNDTLSVSGSAHVFNSDLSNGGSNLTATFNGGVTLGASQHFASLTVNNLGSVVMSANGNRVVVAKALNIVGNGKFDLNDNDMIVDYTSSSPLATIQTKINTARAGGAWTGVGLTSTAAKNHPSQTTTLGAMEAADYTGVSGSTIFDGETIDATAVVVKYTYYGDADLNGLISLDDYANADGGYLLNLTGWINGDFDGSGGKPDLDDYSFIDAAFLTGGPTL
ncbi:MAG: hypothetical protein ACREJC_04655, partial [Tepidisphaeraceae bacterium]